MKKNDWIPMPRFLLRKNALIKIFKKMELTNSKCLEFGFGAGDYLKYFASKGANVTGFDFSKAAVEIAKQRIDGFEYSKNINFVENIDELKEETFDIVLACEVLEHIENGIETLDSWMSYLKPGGSLIISVPAHMSKWNESDVWAGHYKRYEKNELLDYSKSRNLELKSLWNYGFPLSLVLDKLLGASKKGEVANFDESTDKAELSKNSGVDRKNRFIYRLLSNDLALFPFYLIQRMFFNFDLGSGYILHLKKNEK